MASSSQTRPRKSLKRHRRGRGPGKKDEPTTVQVGDTVLYGKYSGTELQHDGNDYMIMRESDILAIL